MLTTTALLLLLSLLITTAGLVTTRRPEDRVVLIDITAFQLLGLTILLALYDQSELPLQFAFMLALLGFISTIILSRLLRPTS